uniref:NADH-ubiquinone oxidoreductase chain 5 n=1 Tax=Eozapus setchuanus TaxID=101673 RepID=A0A0H3UBU1_9RODE|nr:NADH dehydrogenase subunit 5 [Eozapus setchuanus]AIG99664.1 NADH dehydrogenase subunit 5 [Eozapus setchuanus]
MNIMTSSMLTIIILLIIPIMLSIMKSPSPNFPFYVTKTIKLSFMLSMLPILMFLHLGYDSSIFNWHWFSAHSINLVMSFKMDLYSMLFIPIALFVTWSIMEFSTWYMHSDPDLNRFVKYLLMFLITMVILVSANNMFQLFIGWEGVGIMSFMLIGWWHGRSDANTAALQAILYNRIGDIGLVLSISWFMLKSNSLDIQTIMNTYHSLELLPLLGLLLAAVGKSAQFGLHPWLPSAMEGPTPVSALLHSSTMVVAGIFLLIRFYPILDNNFMKTLMLLIGALTTLFTALCAITQNDIKKIIAFSTSSQLGLMMVTLGIGQPYLAFLHICTHAFFKAMLFLCSGSIIHNLNDEQDIRKMGGLAKTMPMTSSFLTIGSLALTGTPFLTGFYSKDLIIESMNMSYTNAWALLITLMATSLTAIYSIRIVFFVFMEHPRFLPVVIINENFSSMINPMKRLAMGSLFAGFILSNSIPPVATPPMTMPMTLKTTALLVTFLGLILALELNNLTHNLTLNNPSDSMKFSSLLGFYPNLTHRLFPNMNLTISQKHAYKLLDLIWLESIFPKLMTNTNILASTMTSNQKGLIKLYFISILLILPIPLILLTS